MICKYLTVATLLLWGALTTSAQQKIYKGNITITPYEVSQKGDSLCISMNIDVNGLNLDSHRSLDLIPVVNSNGGQSVELPAVKICGRNRFKVYKRNLALLGKYSGLLESENYVVVRSGKQKTPITYQYAIPFEKWMKDARLDLKEDLCGCGGATQQINVEQLADHIALEKVLMPYEVVPNVTYVRPEIEEQKKRVQTGEAHLNFLSGKSNILPDFGNNSSELQKIRQLVEDVKNDKDVKIGKITIVGYSSPEGTLARNQKLSEARAIALRNYLAEHYNLPKALYNISFGGEDWDGLVKEVEASDMQYKAEVLQIIRDVPINKGRESKLMALKAGNPYRYMLKEMFPSLRRVIVVVNYDVKAFSLDEAKKVIATRPQNLSMEEMYQVANSYDTDSEEFRHVFETAVLMFPEDDIANLNAAASALSRKDVVSAEKYLSSIRSRVRRHEFENSMGLLLLLKGNYVEAKKWLQQAESDGNKEAFKNLKELELKQANEQQLRTANRQ